MQSFKKNFLILMVVVICFAFFHSAFAQIQDSSVSLTISPENPGPNQNATATLSTYAVDLNKSNISWSLNGKESSSGIGKKSFTFNTGLTSVINIEARIDTINGQSVIKNISIGSVGVDMLWEANNSYSPPFYKGKTLVSSEGEYKVVAIPSLNGSSQKSGNFSYVWTKDGEGQPDASGWGKSYFIFSPSYLDENNTVESEVSNISGSVNMSGKISLNPFSPKIIFYEKDPVFGVKWEKSLSNGFKISPQGGVLFVAPYFFSPNSVNSRELSFGWSVNGEDVNTPVTKNVLSVKPESGQTGTATVKAVITNTKTLFQTLEKELNVIF